MSKNAVLGALTVALLGMLSAIAQESEPPGEVVRDSSERTATPDDGDADEPIADDVFIPSEEVQAAEELAFPVDI